MPPSPLYNWLCVLHSTSEIITHAAYIRAAQTSRANVELRRGLGLRDVARTPAEKAARTSDAHENISVGRYHETSQGNTHYPMKADLESEGVVNTVDVASTINIFEQSTRSAEEEPVNQSITTAQHNKTVLETSQSPPHMLYVPEIEPQVTPVSVNLAEASSYNFGAKSESVPEESEVKLLEAELLPEPSPPLSQTQRNLQASRVPSSRIGRLFHYGGLATSLGYGAASEALRRVSSSKRDETQSSLMMTPANIKRLVEKLSQMRGAALKLGQFMSIQDSHLLPKDVEEVFRRVQDSAHYMPNWQMERVMSDALGPSWATTFSSFDPIPFAAASLGQVHSAVLAANVSPTSKEEKVAVKIQFPDIAKSIESDLGYLRILLNAGRILPKGLFLDKTLQVMKGELADECDYTKEATSARFFASEKGVGMDKRFRVPWIWEGSTERVLIMEHMDGVSVGGTVVDTLSQDSRDQIASTIVELCMKELFEFRMMQTDPNWSNFLWNEKTRQIELIDFGATRSYSREFIDKWMHVLQAAVAEDREACKHWSLELGYLTGEESETMLDAHIRSLTLLATPFRVRPSGDGRYAFGRGSEWARITADIRSLIPIMLNERLTPPPQETYSLNRKLSGAFLLASRLGARVDTKGIWDSTAEKYKFTQQA